MNHFTENINDLDDLKFISIFLLTKYSIKKTIFDLYDYKSKL